MPYDQTLNLAIANFLSGDAKNMAHAAGAVYHSDKGMIESAYLGRPYTIDCANGGATPLGHDTPLPQVAHILLLHNLVRASGRSLMGRLISFRELPKGGEGYYPAFKRRSIDVLTKFFGNNPQMLFNALGSIKGEKQTLGDTSVRINVLPRFPVTYVIWGGDDEFTASGNILFDASASDYLSVEDIAIAASNATYELIRAARANTK